MSSVGETLRRERLQKGLNLEQISRETKISGRLLDAIEKDQFERLPGGVFAKSFVRQYARFLGLDEEELAAEVEKVVHPAADLSSGIAAPPEPAFKVPLVTEWESSSRPTSSVLPALAMVVAVMLVCSAVYAWWQRSRRPAPPPQPTAAARKVTPAVKPPAPGPVIPAHETQAAPTAPAASVQAPSAAPQEAQQPAAIGEQPAAPGAAALHVSLAADDLCWVHVWVDDKSVMVGTLQANESKTFDGGNSIRIRTGNAGSLQVTVNGKPAGPLGPKGQIRNVEITPEGVQSLPPPPKPAPVPEPL